MAKVGPNAVNLAIAEMIGQLLTFTTHPNIHYITYPPSSIMFSNRDSQADTRSRTAFNSQSAVDGPHLEVGANL